MIANHINSTARDSLNGKTPFELSQEKYGIDVLKKLKLVKVNPSDVTLTPKLIK